MRNGQNNNKQRMRGRNNNHHSNSNNNNNNRRGQNPMTRVYESNGPEIKIRGTASHLAEKYVQLARDAQGSGDPVSAENFYQHAEHYFRIIAAAQEQFRQNQPNQPRLDNDTRDESNDDNDNDYSSFGAEPGFVREQPQMQPQPTYQPREPQPYQPREPREQQSRERDGNRDNGNRDQNPRDQGNRDRGYRDNRPQPPMPAQPIEAHIDRLPSFITGSQPQPDIGLGNADAVPNDDRPDRFPRRRRRPHNPRSDALGAPVVPTDDAGGAGD